MKKAMKHSVSFLLVVALIASVFAVSVFAFSGYWYSKPQASKTAYIKTYTLKTGGNIPVYTDEALTKRDTTKDGKKRYITRDDDPCKIIKISADYNSVKVRYILSSGGTHDGWVSASEFVNNSQLNDWQKEAYPSLSLDESYTVYRRSDGKKDFGYIARTRENDRDPDDNNKDIVWILEETKKGNYVQVIYQVTVGSEKGTYKMGWMKQASANEFVADPAY